MTRTILTGKLLLGALYASIAVAILATTILVASNNPAPQKKVFLGGVEIIVTVVDTPALQEKGLSEHKPLGPKEGMLFVFPEPKQYGFWMKGMLFPIDIIWFDVNRKVVDVLENATPLSYPKIYTPHAESQYVLEVEAGFFASHALKIGDVLELEPHTRYTE